MLIPCWSGAPRNWKPWQPLSVGVADMVYRTPAMVAPSQPEPEQPANPIIGTLWREKADHQNLFQVVAEHDLVDTFDVFSFRSRRTLAFGRPAFFEICQLMRLQDVQRPAVCEGDTWRSLLTCTRVPNGPANHFQYLPGRPEHLDPKSKTLVFTSNEDVEVLHLPQGSDRAIVRVLRTGAQHTIQTRQLCRGFVLIGEKEGEK